MLRGVGVVVALLLVLVIVSFFVDEPIRRTMEANMNRDLQGYTVRLPGLHFQLIGLSVTLKDLTISQEAHPTPPVARFPRLHAHIHWGGLFRGKLVAEFDLDRPQIHMNLPQLSAEAHDTTPVKDKGWQRAIEDIYPLKINHVNVTDGDLVYIDVDSARPLHLSRIDMQADNIRNAHSADRVYPSSFHFRSVVFDRGRAAVDGHANFLAEPTPGIRATFQLERVPLDYFKPIAARANLLIEGGVFATHGEMEYAPTIKTVHIRDLTISDMRADYVHTNVTAASEKTRAKKVGNAAAQANNNPGMELRVDHLRLTGCTFGMINKSKPKPYRVFLSGTEMELTNLSNHFVEGPAEARLVGKFMGSGTTLVTAKFRPEKTGPDFDMDLKIENTRLRTMNDLLRAYGNFDVTAGIFSLYTQLRIKNNHVSGYVKPLFKDMKVYDKRQDREKSAFRKLYEMVVGGVAKLLENAPRKEVATKANLSGPAGAPHTNTWQVIGQLIKNAFFKAILPGFERQVSSQRSG